MKITIESRKSTWVPFIESDAKLELSWRARCAYTQNNIYNEQTWPVKTRYSFSDFHSEHSIPSSQLIIMEDGIPTAITETVVSALKNRFQSEEIDDPFVEISDKVAKLERTAPQQRSISNMLYEESWSETITRILKIENKTGKKVQLSLTLLTNPAQSLSFVASKPAPQNEASPEYRFDVALDVDMQTSIEVQLRIDKKKTIQETTDPRTAQNNRNTQRAPRRTPVAQQTMNQGIMEIQQFQERNLPDE